MAEPFDPFAHIPRHTLPTLDVEAGAEPAPAPAPAADPWGPNPFSAAAPAFSTAPPAPEVPNDEGIGGITSGAISRGYNRWGETYYGQRAMLARRQLENIARIEKQRAASGLPLPENLVRMREELTRDIPGLEASASEWTAESMKTRPPKAVEDLARAEGFSAAWNAFWQDPIKIIYSIGLESLVGQAPALAAAVPAGIVGGPAGAAAVIGAGSAAQEYISSIRSALAESGVDLRKPEAVIAALNDPEKAAAIRDKAAIKAGIVGGFDAASAGIASRMFPGLSSITNPYTRHAANIPAQVATQGVLGGAGEGLGTVAAGDEFKWGPVVSEVVGEAFGAPAEVLAMRHIAGRRVPTEANPSPTEQFNATAAADPFAHIPREPAPEAPIAPPASAAPVEPPRVETAPEATPEPPARDVDELGLYSAALEAAREWKQPRGTPQQAIKYLKSKGVKDAEIEATGLDAFLADKKSVTREELASFLEQNRTRLLEAKYGINEEDARAIFRSGMRPLDEDGTMDRARLAEGSVGKPNWHRYSLEPSNPTYFERVVHLPQTGPEKAAVAKAVEWVRDKTGTDPYVDYGYINPQDYIDLAVKHFGMPAPKPVPADADFRSGHFPQPNIVGHYQASTQKDASGKNVFTLSQIQSDWGQQLRDSDPDRNGSVQRLEQELARLKEGRKTALGVAANMIDDDIRRVQSELLMARKDAASLPKNPLVNTTDQWTNTTLRRALKDAVDSGAESIAIPSGDTVLSYNPGGEHGMQEFYDKIVPKNLGNLLKKMDPSIKGERVPALKSHDGKKDLGKGFTVFPITDKVRKAVAGGQPMYARSMSNKVADQIAKGKTFNVLPAVYKKVLSVANDLGHMWPADVSVYAVKKVEPLTAGDYKATLVSDGGSEISLAGPLEDIRSTRAIYDTLSDGPAIISFRFDLAGDVDHGIRGELAHEGLHALWSALPADVRSDLLAHGDSLGVLSTGLKDAFTRSGYANEASNVDNSVSLYELYHKAYQGDSLYRDMMDQEVAAHMLQWYVTGALTPEQVAPVQHILDGMLRGDYARGDAAATAQGPMAAITRTGATADNEGSGTAPVRPGAIEKATRHTPAGPWTTAGMRGANVNESMQPHALPARDVGTFVRSSLVPDESASVTVDDAYQAYVDRVAGKPMSQPEFIKKMADQGIMRQHMAGKDRYVGFRLRPSQGPMASISGYGGSQPPSTALSTIRSMGGIKDPKGELKQIIGKHASGRGSALPGVINKNGMEPDKAREYLSQRGFLPPDSDINDMYELIRRVASGERVVAEQDMAAELDYQEQQRGEMQDEAARAKVVEEAADYLRQYGLEYNLSDVEETRLIDYIRQGMDMDSALERVTMETYHDIEGAKADSGRNAQEGVQVPEGIAAAPATGTTGAQNAGPSQGSGQVPAGIAGQLPITPASQMPATPAPPGIPPAPPQLPLTGGGPGGFRGDRATRFQNLKRDLTQYLQNSEIRVRDIVEQAEQLGPVRDESDPYLKMTLFHGRVGDLIEKGKNASQEIINDSQKLAKEQGTSLETVRKLVNEYLIAQHAPERNAKHGDGAAGMTTAEAGQIMAVINSHSAAPGIKAIADKALALNAQQLDLLHDAGVISDFTYNTLNNTYKKHVPLQRIMDTTDDVGSVLGGQSFDVRTTGIRKAKGSDRDVADVLGNIILNYEQAVLRSEKNIVDNATANFVQDYQSEMNDIAKIKPPPVIGQRQDGSPIFARPTERDLEFYRNGTKTWIEFKDVNTAQAFRGANREQLGSVLRGLGAFTRLYAGLMTRFNPEFAAPNKLRDLQEVLVYMSAQKQIGAKGAMKTLTADAASIKAVTDWARGKDTPATRQYEEMKRLGGTTGGMGLSTRQEVGIKLEKLEKLAQSKGRRGIKAAIDAVDTFNTIFEDSSRLSVYKAALAAGLSPARAAAHAKEASINFNRFGTAGQSINALYMFANASIQGSAKMLRAMKNPKVAGAVISIMGLAIAGAAQWNDKLDKDWRKKVTKWDYQNGLNFVIPSKDGSFRYISIPVSWGLKPFVILGNALYNAATGADKVDVTDTIGDVLGAALQAYNPVGGTSLAQIATPTIADLPVDIYSNMKWSGTPIRPEGFPNTPDDVKYFKNLRETPGGRAAIWTTTKLQETWPNFEVSPANLHYIVESLSGGPGRTLLKTITTATGWVKGDEVKASDYPMVSRFYRSRDAEEVGMASLRGPGETAKRELERETRERFRASERADVELKELRKLPPEDAKKKFDDIQKSDRKLASDIGKIAKRESEDRTRVEDQIKRMESESGARARYVVKEVLKDVAADDRDRAIADLHKRKVINNRDRMYINRLLKGDDKLPTRPPRVRAPDFSDLKRKEDKRKGVTADPFAHVPRSASEPVDPFAHIPRR